MKTRTTTVIASVLIIALIAVGIGYAYTSTVTTENNVITSENIKVSPMVGNNVTYYDSSTNIDYDTNYTKATGWMYGIKNKIDVKDVNGCQRLSPIDALLIENEGAEKKTLKSLTIEVTNNSILIDQLKGTTTNTGTSTPMYSNNVYMFLSYTSGNTTYWCPMDNSTGTDKNVKFTTDFTKADAGFVKDVEGKTGTTNGSITYGFYYVIVGDETTSNNTVTMDYCHSAPLDGGAFKMKYVASADKYVAP